MTTKKHHPASPSALGRVADCPPSMHAAAPYDSSDKYSEDGDLCHEAMAACLARDGREEGAPGLTQDQQEAVDRCMGFYMGLGTEGLSDPYQDVEITMDLRLGDDVIPEYGTADLILIHQDEGIAHVVDWKFGRLEIEEEHAALQLMAYSAMVFQAYKGLKTIHAHIYQPRLDRHHKAEYSAEALPLMEARIKQIIDAGNNPKAEFRPQIRACRYCAFAPHCEALKEVSMGLVEASPQVVMKPEVVDDLYEKMQLAERFLKALKPELRAAIKAGCSNKWEAKSRNGARKIVDPFKLRERLRIDPKEFIALGKWGLSPVRELTPYTEKEFFQMAGDSVEKGADTTVIVKRKEPQDGK